MIKFEHFLKFENWLERDAFLPTFFSVCINLYLGPLTWWWHRGHDGWFYLLRARFFEYGFVGRFLFKLIDTTDMPYPTRGETIVFLIGVVLYTVIWGIFSPIFVVFAILIATTETLKGKENV